MTEFCIVLACKLVIEQKIFANFSIFFQVCFTNNLTTLVWTWLQFHFLAPPPQIDIDCLIGMDNRAFRSIVLLARERRESTRNGES